MKKSFFLIIYLFCSFTISNAFFGESHSLNLYKNIDKGIINLQDKFIEIELSGGEDGKGILAEINKLAQNKGIIQCLNESKQINIDDIDRIKDDQDLSVLKNYMDSRCRNLVDGSYNIHTLNNYVNLFFDYYQKSVDNSIKKTKQIYKISNIGLYSDGIIENSGFDLISDIDDINKIIFKDIIEYKGGKQLDISDKVNGLLKGIKNISNKKYDNIFLQNNFKKNTVHSQKENILLNNKKIYSLSDINKSNYVCLDNSIGDSGFSSGTLDLVLNNIDNSFDLNNNSNDLEGSINKGGIDNLDNKELNNKGEYNKVTDNSIWSCNKFFCIKIEFLSYIHKLLKGGENITIQYLIDRSNKHLKKAASTSLVQAKMSLNNFEIGLKDLNLPDIFHLSFIISTKPVPILQIEKKGKKNNTIFASKNLLKQYYKNLNLDYTKRNSLVLLKRLEQNKQNLLNAGGLAILEVSKRDLEYNKNIDLNNKTEILNKIIEKKVYLSSIKTFEKEFIEISAFTKSIEEYSLGINNAIKKMNEIPEGS